MHAAHYKKVSKQRQILQHKLNKKSIDKSSVKSYNKYDERAKGGNKNDDFVV